MVPADTTLLGLLHRSSFSCLRSGCLPLVSPRPSTNTPGSIELRPFCITISTLLPPGSSPTASLTGLSSFPAVVLPTAFPTPPETRPPSYRPVGCLVSGPRGGPHRPYSRLYWRLLHPAPFRRWRPSLRWTPGVYDDPPLVPRTKPEKRIFFC